MTEWTDFLTARGYLRIQLTRSGVGHFHTGGTLNGRSVEVLVDTGAACTVVAMSVVEALGLRSEWIDRGAGGAGGPSISSGYTARTSDSARSARDWPARSG